MGEFLSGSALFAILLTFGAYELGRLFQQKTGVALFNPILVAAVLTGAVLAAAGVPNQVYQQHCEVFSWLLTPATVCLAIPLHAQFSRLRHDLPAILAGVGAGTLVSLGFVWAMARLCRLDAVLTASLLPKSVTTAIAVAIADSGGGIRSIAAAAVIAAGLTGALFSPLFARLFRITDPIAQGVGIGASSHALGTSKAREMGELQGAMSSIAIGVCGLLTVLLSLVLPL